MKSQTYSILVVDDEAGQRRLLTAALEEDYRVVCAANGSEAQQLLKHQSFDLMITDQRMPELDGIELLRWSLHHCPEMPVILLTAFGSVGSAVEAMKLGAENYLTKPLENPDELRLVVARVLESRDLRSRKKLQDADEASRSGIVAESRAMRQVVQLAEQVAGEDTTVLITGESGTGKEVLSRHIHARSARKAGAFVAVNCAALPETLLEPELFGHEKGAFTGATALKQGRFELAHGGTLFLDEIGVMGPELQSKLLRAVQEREFERVGGTRTLHVDVRIVAATNQDLQEAIQAGTFREDLYYRLNVFPLHIPPLRERRGDILPLAEHLIGVLAARMGKRPLALSAEARVDLRAYDWPGNVRELNNVIERALILAPDRTIERTHLSVAASGRPETVPSTLAELEQNAILDALERYDGDRRKVAERLGISLRKLQYRLTAYGVTGRKKEDSE